MPIKPNKPILFGVYHDHKYVDECLDSFKRTITGRKVLYIELDAEMLSAIPEYQPKVPVDPREVEAVFKGSVGAYQLLAREALRAGLKVLPLDERKMSEKYDRDKFQSMQPHSKEQKYRVTPSYVAYQNTELREKKWEGMLRNATSTTVVVATTGHLSGLRERLHVPEQNCIFHKAGSITEKWRRVANETRKRIEAERTARRLKKAKERERRSRRL
jgi:hypothetical protein